MTEEPALKSWGALNKALHSADEAECRRLLRLERRWKGRKVFLFRIYGRLNRVRAARERKALW